MVRAYAEGLQGVRAAGRAQSVWPFVVAVNPLSTRSAFSISRWPPLLSQFDAIWLTDALRCAEGRIGWDRSNLCDGPEALRVVDPFP